MPRDAFWRKWLVLRWAGIIIYRGHSAWPRADVLAWFFLNLGSRDDHLSRFPQMLRQHVEEDFGLGNRLVLLVKRPYFNETDGILREQPALVARQCDAEGTVALRILTERRAA